MNTKLKKLLGIVLAVLLLVSAVPATGLTAFAADTSSVNEAKIGKTEYATLEKAIEEADEGDTVVLLKDVTLKGGYTDSTEGLRIEKPITINGNGHTIDCGEFQKGIRLYNEGTAAEYKFSDVTIVNNNTAGRCIDTRTGGINLRINNDSKLIATGTNSQPLTIGGSESLDKVVVEDTTIDAGKSGYAIIVFVKVTAFYIQNGSNISGYAALYVKGDSSKITVRENCMLATTNDYPQESGVFGTVVLEGTKNTVYFEGEGVSVAAKAPNTASQALFNIKNQNNKVVIRSTDIQLITEGNAAMVAGEKAFLKTFTLNDQSGLFVENGYVISGSNNQISMKDFAANVGENYDMPSLQEAVNFVAAGSTITLLADGQATVNKPMTIVKNGYTATITAAEGFKVEEDDTAYIVKEFVGAAKIGDKAYETVKDALDAAVDGDTVTMAADAEMADILVIDKAITLDGNGKTLTSTAPRAINVDVEGKVVIKNLTINASGERAINVIYKPATLTIENVTATAANYTVNLASAAGAAVVTINNSTLTGLNVVNVTAPGSNITVTNSTLNCVDQNDAEAYAALVLSKDATGATITANGVTINVDGDSVKARNDAEGGDITIDGSTGEVESPVAYITYGDNYYSFYTLAEAIEFAKNNETIVLLKDINLTAKDFGEKHDGYNTFFNISGKSITIDLNGKNITADVSGEELDNFILGVFVTTNNGHLTLKGEGAVKGISGADQEDAYLVASKGNTDYNYNFYSLLVNYDDGCSITIHGGDYYLDYAGDSLIYSSCSAEFEGQGVRVRGGSFKVGNLGTIRNGMPWTFNVRGQNGRHTLVTGGTFYADIQHQYYTFEVLVPKELALQKNEDGSYTVVNAVAYVTERVWCSSWYTNEVGYATLEEAIAAAEGPQTMKYYKKYYPVDAEVVVLLKNIELENSIVIASDKNFVLDLNGYTISQTKECTSSYEMIANNGTLTIKDSVGTGKISLTDTGAGDPNFGWGSYTIRNSGTLVVEGGTIEFNGEQAFGKHCSLAIFQYSGSTTINGGNIINNDYRSVRLWHGDMTINGGNFEGQVWVHCVDDSAELTINGGSFAPAKDGGDASSVFVNNSGYTAKLSITGGNFATKVGANDVNALAGCITGGEFTESAKANTNPALFA